MVKKQNDPPKTPATLTQTVDQAKAALTDRIRIGHGLLEHQIKHGGDMEIAKANFQKWTDYNVSMLERMFTTEQIAREYEWSGSGSVTMVFGERSPADDFNYKLDAIKAEIQNLDSLLDRIELYASSPPSAQARARPARAALSAASPSRVFIVHGQDGEARESVARFLEKAGVEAVILHEQANRGDTIIEKLERNSDVHFAVVLLTGDDEGRRKDDANPSKPRARQNVILELGYFVALLGRKNVCALYQDGVELPSDWNGVVWVALDAHHAWKYKLGNELKAAGFPIDLNHVLT
jgi:predicted nucleotide-binding protein